MDILILISVILSGITAGFGVLVVIYALTHKSTEPGYYVWS